MSLSIILIVAVLLSIGFHYVGVYAKAQKVVWITLVLLWAGAINIAMSEVKPKAYDDLKKIEGKYADTDTLIQEAKPEISIYEMILIKSSFVKHEPKR